MTSTGPDRDSGSSNPSDKNGNPFIRFKQFADAQVGAVLQGIIGLPSVFAKQPNTRWRDLDDDLKRREARRADQSSGSSGTYGHSEDEEVVVPVKKFKGRLLPPHTASERSDDLHIQKTLTRDFDKNTIELFSPVTKAVFAHLQRNPKHQKEWLHIPHKDIGWTTHHNDLFRPLAVYEAQKQSTYMNMLRSLVYDDLNATVDLPGCRHFHSQASVLPYILYSPYSPLMLSNLPPPNAAEKLPFPIDKEFPYCAAFTDLLFASKGEDMGILDIAYPFEREVTEAMYTVNVPIKESSEFRKARLGYQWLHDLHSWGLLARDEGPVPSQLSSHGPMHPSIPCTAEETEEHEFMIPTRTEESTAEPRERNAIAAPPTSQEPRTELDLYDVILNILLPTREHKEAVAKGYNEFIREIFASFIPSSTSSSAQSAQSSTTTTTKAISTSTSTQTDPALQPSTSMSQPSEDTPYLITTSTSTTTNVLGMSVTTTTIEKRFDDGSVERTETSTSKTPPKARIGTSIDKEWYRDERDYDDDEEEEEDDEEWLERMELMDRERRKGLWIKKHAGEVDGKGDGKAMEKEGNVPGEERHGKGKGKGWFWN